MSINFNNIDSFVHRTTVRTIREVLDSRLTEDNDERRRQEKLASLVKKRNLNAEDQTREAADVDEAEVEEEEEEVTQDTGVPPAGDKPGRADRTGGKGTADSPKLDTPTLKQIEKPSPEAVIDKLNALRGGKSLKDAAIRKSFEQYFKALGQDEKESLLIYLTAIAQILAGVTTGAEAIDPSDVGIQTKEPEKVHAKHIAKTRTVPSSGKEASREREAIPIVVGEQQRKHGIMKILEAYKNLS